MSVNNKIRALLNIKNKKTQDLSECLGISVQAVRNKFTRNSFSADDLIKIASYLECDLAFIIDENQRISLDMSDIKGNDDNKWITKLQLHFINKQHLLSHIKHH